jgi:hypothetical protein
MRLYTQLGQPAHCLRCPAEGALAWSGGDGSGEGEAGDGLWWPPMRHDHLRIASSGKCGDPVDFAAWQLLLSMLCPPEEAAGSQLAATSDAIKAVAVPVLEEEPQGQPSATSPPPRPPPLPPISPKVEAGIVASQCSAERRAEVAATGMGPLMDWGCEVESVSGAWLASAGLWQLAMPATYQPARLAGGHCNTVQLPAHATISLEPFSHNAMLCHPVPSWRRAVPRGLCGTNRHLPACHPPLRIPTCHGAL